MSRVAVVGAGAWGVALALQAGRGGHSVALVARDVATACAIEKSRESRRLPGHRIPESVDIRADAPSDADVSLWVVPTQHLRSTLLRLRPVPGPIVVCAKGV